MDESSSTIPYCHKYNSIFVILLLLRTIMQDLILMVKTEGS